MEAGAKKTPELSTLVVYSSTCAQGSLLLKAGLFCPDKRMVTGKKKKKKKKGCQFSRRAQTLAVASLDVYVNFEHQVLI